MATTTRTSTSERSRSGMQAGRPGSLVQSKDYPRIVPQKMAAEGADRMLRLSGMFAVGVENFKNKVQEYYETKQREDLKKKKEEDELLGKEAIRLAIDRPSDVEAAIASGDPAKMAALSTLQGIDANRPEFLRALKYGHGENRAIRDFQEKLLPTLQSLDYLSGNPVKVRDDFTDEQMKGADPDFDFAYRTTMQKLSDEAIGHWLGQQRAYMIERQIETSIDTLRAKVLGGMDIGVDEVNETIGRSVGIAQGAGDKLRARDKAIYEIFKMAHESGNGSLLSALTRPDPANNGLSLADLNRDLWDRALSGAVEQYNRVKSVEAEQDLSRLSLMMSGVASGLPPVVTTPAGEQQVDASYIMTELNAHYHKYGPSAAWESMMKQGMSLLGKEVAEETNYEAFERAVASAAISPDVGAPYISSKDMDAYGEKFVDRYTKRRLEEGASPAQVFGELGKIAADYGGLGKDFNKRQQHKLLAGSPEEVAEAYTLLAAVEKSRPESGAAAAMISDEMAKSKFDFMYTFVERFKGDPTQAVQLFQEASKLTGTTDWRGYLKKALPDKERKKLVDDVVSDLSDALDDADIPFGVRNIAEEELSRQLWMHSNTLGTDKITRVVKDAVVKGMSDRLELGYDPLTQRRVAVQRLTPRVIMLHDGSLKSAPPLTRQVHKEAAKAFGTQITPLLGKMFGEKVVGLNPTREAEKGYGVAVIVENNVGAQGELIFPYGEIEDEDIDKAPNKVNIKVPPKDLPEGMSWTGKGIKVEDTGKPIRLGDFLIAKHPTIPGYAAVYYVGPQPKTHAEIISDRRAALLKRGEELEKSRLQNEREKAAGKAAAEERSRALEKEFSETGRPPNVLPPPPTTRKGGYYDEETGEVIKETKPVSEPTVSNRKLEDDINDIKEALGFIGEKLNPKETEADDRNFFQRLYDKAKKSLSEAPAKAVGGVVGQAVPLVGGPVGEAVGGVIDEALSSVRKWFAAPSKEEAERTGRGVPPSQEEKWQEKFRNWLHKSSYNGYISGDSMKEAGAKLNPKNEEEFFTSMSQAYHLASARGNNWSGWGQANLMASAVEMIRTEEGYSAVSYKDGSSRSIGYGFNLKRQDFRNILKSLGYDVEKVWNGSQTLQKEHAVLIRNYELQRLYTNIRQRLGGKSIPQHSLLALIDFAYNLGEGALTPVIEKIKDGDMLEAAKLILTKQPPKSLPARTQEVLIQRRVRNASMFLGVGNIHSITKAT